jgi:hypothetical protein
VRSDHEKERRPWHNEGALTQRSRGGLADKPQHRRASRQSASRGIQIHPPETATMLHILMDLVGIWHSVLATTLTTVIRKSTGQPFGVRLGDDSGRPTELTRPAACWQVAASNQTLRCWHGNPGPGGDLTKARGTAFNTGDGFQVNCSVTCRVCPPSQRVSHCPPVSQMSAGNRRSMECAPKTCVVCPALV